MSHLPDLLSVARGDRPADLVLRDARLINVLSGEIEPADVAVAGAFIAGVGSGYRGGEEIDLGGRYLCPGLIDAHVHVESSMVPPSEFARAVVPAGVTTVITDPHEIANVCGLTGIRFMLRDAESVPLDSTLADALEVFERTGSWVLPVVDGHDLAGLISKSTLFDRYREELSVQTST